jgi:hypothetical protein
MDKNDKKTEIVETPKVPEETVSEKKKLTRKFTWTPARKAAFEKCVAARKNGLQSKPTKKDEPKVTESVEKPKLLKYKQEVESSSSDELSSSSSDESIKPMKKKSKKTKKQFKKLKNDLEKIKKQIQKKKRIVRKRKPKPKALQQIEASSESDSDSESEQEQSEQHTQAYSRNRSTYCFV